MSTHPLTIHSTCLASKKHARPGLLTGLLLAVVVTLASAPVVTNAFASTPDGETPAEESVCNELSGALKGLCNAYCEAMDCEGEANASENACDRTLANYLGKSGGEDPPCIVQPPDPNTCPCFTADDLRPHELDRCFSASGGTNVSFLGWQCNRAVRTFVASNGPETRCRYAGIRPDDPCNTPREDLIIEGLTPAQQEHCTQLIKDRCAAGPAPLP